MRLKDLGEKEIIRSIIKPLFNPGNELGLAGDDCAVIDVSKDTCICISTDRVPADLISFKLGLIGYFELGYYLAILNISDIVANGAIPVCLLLTLAFEDDFSLDNFKSILTGVKKACEEYGCFVAGGDLSNASEMSISATSVGIANPSRVLYRRGARIGDYIYCSDHLGLSSTAFHYFLKARPAGFRLSPAEEEILINQFKKPVARLALSKNLTIANCRVTCMDNTDGIGQTFKELSELNSIKFELKEDLLPIHDVSNKIAEFLQLSVLDVVLSGGADFQLVGTIEGNADLKQLCSICPDIRIIGRTYEGTGLWIKERSGDVEECRISGWDYYNFKIGLLRQKP